MGLHMCLCTVCGGVCAGRQGRIRCGGSKVEEDKKQQMKEMKMPSRARKAHPDVV